MARPRQRHRFFLMRMSPEERDRLRKAAAYYGVSMAALVDVALQPLYRAAGV